MALAAALVLLSPLFLGLAIWIRLIDGAPILFRQERIGVHGRRFSVVKFRSMVPDAEARLQDLAARNEITGPAFKLSDDPRLTRTGRMLRRTSLDELPQFWNVLRGEMSLVGPRPPLPTRSRTTTSGTDGACRCSPVSRVCGRSRPGATRISTDGSLDLDYIDRWSLWLDLKIIVRTIPAVFSGEGR